MKVEFWLTGKTKEGWVTDGMAHYQKRCKRFCNISVEIIPESRFTKPEEIVKDETGRILQKLSKSPAAYTVLLDETGVQLGSIEFASLISKQQSAGYSSMRFIIGGAFGVQDTLHNAVDFILSLSTMTFPHQLVRIFFLEQLYRAFTILRGEGYHHE